MAPASSDHLRSGERGAGVGRANGDGAMAAVALACGCRPGADSAVDSAVDSGAATAGRRALAACPAAVSGAPSGAAAAAASAMGGQSAARSGHQAANSASNVCRCAGVLTSSAPSSVFSPLRSSCGWRAKRWRKRSTSPGPTGTPPLRSAARKSPSSARRSLPGIARAA